MKRLGSLLLTFLMVLTIMPTAFAENVSFEDVKTSDWYYESVMYLTDKGIITGTDVSHFSPTEKLTIGQVMVMISRKYISPINENPTWDEQVNTALTFMVSNNIVTATDYTPDKMDVPITRYQLAQIVSGILKRDGLKIDDAVYSLLSYSEKLSEKYSKDVYNCYIAGVMNGCDGNGTFYGDKQLLRSEGATTIYRLLVPEKRTDFTGFRDYTKLLSSFSTTYDNSVVNRSFNICKAANEISNTVVGSGKEFSFNNVIGDADKSNGYKLSTVISGGKYVNGYGGGVCQSSTTLFNAALLANMKITERHCHALKSDYVGPGLDATISSFVLDLKFVNPYDSNIKIISKCGNGKVEFFILGGQNITVPEIKLNVTKNKNIYTLTRTANGESNYVVNSKYKN